MVKAILPDGPGEYAIELLAKAAPKGSPEIFEEPFLRQLERAAKGAVRTARETVWHVLERWLRRAKVTRPSDADPFELQEALFDVTRASTASVVGIRIPDRMRPRLERLGWKPPAQEIEYPTVAYRMGLIREQLANNPGLSYEWVLKLAHKQILTPKEVAAANWARRRAGMNLAPIFDDTGRAWTARRELRPLRELVSEGIEERAEIREMIADYDQSQRGLGTTRDAERVIRTEIANARAMGAWQAEIRPLKDEQMLYRVPSTGACRGCLRLWLLPDGTPRLYTKAAFAAGEAQGFNTGDWRAWHPVIGAVHPNCHPGDVVVSNATARVTMARRYEGELIVFRTASGHELPVTPNHPILTDRGWLAAGLLHEGAHVFSSLRREPVSFVGSDEQHVPAPIEQIAQALNRLHSTITRDVPTTAEDFHGDGMDGQVAVVRTNGELGRVPDCDGIEHSTQSKFVSAHLGALHLLLAEGAAEFLLCGDCAPSRRGICRGSGSLSFLSRHDLELEPLGLTVGARQAEAFKRSENGFLVQADGDGDLTSTVARRVEFDDLGFNGPAKDAVPPGWFLDRIVRHESRSFSGPVHNMETARGYYLANGIVSSNCACSPPQKYSAAIAGVFQRHAAARVKTLTELKVFAE